MPMIDLRSRETLIQQINELDEKNEKQQQEIDAFKEENKRLQGMIAAFDQVGCDAMDGMEMPDEFRFPAQGVVYKKVKERKNKRENKRDPLRLLAERDEQIKWLQDRQQQLTWENVKYGGVIFSLQEENGQVRKDNQTLKDESRLRAACLKFFTWGMTQANSLAPAPSVLDDIVNEGRETVKNQPAGE